MEPLTPSVASSVILGGFGFAGWIIRHAMRAQARSHQEAISIVREDFTNYRLEKNAEIERLQDQIIRGIARESSIVGLIGGYGELADRAIRTADKILEEVSKKE